ncbi:hypothetical protein TNCV_637411 [Trichonephila clavipes]|nr:hypothetical protein TNCV_637411 [Trichonephila clavipes]
MYVLSTPTCHGLVDSFKNTGCFMDHNSSDKDSISELTDMSYTRLFMTPQRKKYRGDKLGHLEGQSMGPPRSIHLFEMSCPNGPIHNFHNEMVSRSVETT